jgi:hypothetical protein
MLRPPFSHGGCISDAISFDLERGRIYDISCPDQRKRRFASLDFMDEDLETCSNSEV